MGTRRIRQGSLPAICFGDADSGTAMTPGLRHDRADNRLGYQCEPMFAAGKRDLDARMTQQMCNQSFDLWGIKLWE
jgi:hypothetical protein